MQNGGLIIIIALLTFLEMNAKCLTILRWSVNDDYPSPRSQMINGRQELEARTSESKVRAYSFLTSCLFPKEYLHPEGIQ